MNTHKILIVDDEPDICEILAYNLSSEGYKTVCVNSAEEALKVLTADYSLILLDIMMEGMSGYKMAMILRSRGNSIPIIFITAKDAENDMLTGFSVGGDDYISKPFSLKEVSVRVKAMLKRHENGHKISDKFTSGDLTIDFDAKDVFIEGRCLSLTKTEFEILSLLATHSGRIFSREEIIDKVWGERSYITERTVDVHITRLRKKLCNYSTIISNRSGYGYRFDMSKL